MAMKFGINWKAIAVGLSTKICLILLMLPLTSSQAQTISLVAEKYWGVTADAKVADGVLSPRLVVNAPVGEMMIMAGAGYRHTRPVIDVGAGPRWERFYSTMAVSLDENGVWGINANYGYRAGRVQIVAATGFIGSKLYLNVGVGCVIFHRK
jgi:hypothetical protein